MDGVSYLQRREKIEHYFDRTAAEAWKRLTSDAPVGRVRATVRAGRERMLATLLSWLPDDLSGIHILDAGCGTGALAVEAARRGALVEAVDLSAALIAQAEERAAGCEPYPGQIHFRVGDMLETDSAEFDYVVAMDSLIHYKADDYIRILERLTGLARNAVLVTYAPKTPALTLMHVVGRMVPGREHRAPAIEPLKERVVRRAVADASALSDWNIGRTERIASGFYTSQALELTRQ